MTTSPRPCRIQVNTKVALTGQHHHPSSSDILMPRRSHHCISIVRFFPFSRSTPPLYARGGDGTNNLLPCRVQVMLTGRQHHPSSSDILMPRREHHCISIYKFFFFPFSTFALPFNARGGEPTRNLLPCRMQVMLTGQHPPSSISFLMPLTLLFFHFQDPPPRFIPGGDTKENPPPCGGYTSRYPESTILSCEYLLSLKSHTVLNECPLCSDFNLCCPAHPRFPVFWRSSQNPYQNARFSPNSNKTWNVFIRPIRCILPILFF